ncbi:unnamed protein product [Cuscuta campestris]|uniref:FHA domain-containing protein n=1 Tax=Cuscuta campestris TaxID=132261 RepID=A0A484N0Y9_9ASTE|nr:unnamed protein product [Cuscuta campestris]
MCAQGGEVQGPMLKLTVERGSLAGQALDFKPGTTVRVGRVVRGNNLTIKDSGISSNHLTIEFNPSDGKWIIRDLGSSNGTFLNANKVIASSPAALSDCDTIKIGELTTIYVRIEGLGPPSTKQRRNPRQKAAAETAQQDDQNAAENRELGFRDEELGKMQRCGPRTRARARVNSDKAELQAESIGLETAAPRRTRNSRKVENFTSSTSQVESAVVEKAVSLREMETASQNEDELGGQRRTRGRGRGRVTTKRVTTRSTKVSDLQADSIASVHLEEDKDETNPASAKKSGGEEKLKTIEEGGEEEEQPKCGKEAGHGESKGVPDIGVKFDLETMSLGDWLDYLEFQLPKQIMDSTEEMISGMKEKARKAQDLINEKKAEEKAHKAKE